MATIENNVKILSEKLREKEKSLNDKANFCKEHKFFKEEEHIRLKVNIVREIRFEVELLDGQNDLRPYFDF